MGRSCTPGTRKSGVLLGARPRLWRSTSYSHRKATAAALLLALAPAPSGGHAALEENSAAFIPPGSELLRRIRRAVQVFKGPLPEHLQTPRPEMERTGLRLAGAARPD